MPVPSSAVSASQIGDGIAILDLLAMVELIPSKAEGRRLVQQGGLSIDGEKVTDAALLIEPARLEGEGIVVKKGKKVFHRITLE